MHRQVHTLTHTRAPATASTAQMVRAAAPSHTQRDSNSPCSTWTEPALEESSAQHHSPSRFLVSAPGQQTSQEKTDNVRACVHKTRMSAGVCVNSTEIVLRRTDARNTRRRKRGRKWEGEIKWKREAEFREREVINRISAYLCSTVCERARVCFAWGQSDWLQYYRCQCLHPQVSLLSGLQLCVLVHNVLYMSVWVYVWICVCGGGACTCLY